jgi:hypothetical protein
MALNAPVQAAEVKRDGIDSLPSVLLDLELRATWMPPLPESMYEDSDCNRPQRNNQSLGFPDGALLSI